MVKKLEKMEMDPRDEELCCKRREPLALKGALSAGLAPSRKNTPFCNFSATPRRAFYNIDKEYRKGVRLSKEIPNLTAEDSR